MGDQKKVDESNSSSESASKGIARGVTEFVRDVVTLAELQFQLFVADVQECRQSVLVPSLVLFVGAMLGLASLPIALTALALGISHVSELPYAVGFLLAAVFGAVASVLLCVIGWLRLRKQAHILGRSQQELVHNLNWLKKTLLRSTESTEKQAE